MAATNNKRWRPNKPASQGVIVEKWQTTKTIKAVVHKKKWLKT